MNNKGFTLIELIATIALLAIIAIISFVSINGVLDESKTKDCESLVKSIKSATKEYFSDNRYKIDNISSYIVSDKKYKINANVLISGNYLNSQVTNDDEEVMLDNPFTDGYINPSDVSINVELNDDYTVKNIIIGAPEILKTCVNE